MCKTILIVDDDAVIRLALTRAFKGEDYEPIAVGTGKEALDVLTHKEVYAMILDYDLPDLDGLSIVKILNRHPSLKKIPVIVISGHDKLELIGQAYEAGIPLFLRKRDMVLSNMPDFVDTVALMKKYAMVNNERNDN